MRIRELAQPKPVTVSPETSVVDAATRMRRFHVGDLVVTEVVGSHDRPVGILTDRDVCIGIVGPAVESIQTLSVGDVISEDRLVTVNENQNVEQAVDLMQEHGIRRLPVVDDANALVGIVTLDDVLDHFTQQLAKLSLVVEKQRMREAAERR